MLNKIVFASFLILVSLSLALPAEAQRKSDFRDSIDFLLDDGEMTPDEMELEAIGVYNRCQANVNKKTYFDCECIGGAFLAQREEVGPYVIQYELLKEVYGNRPECVNDVEIAGMAYTDCINNAKITRRTDTNNEEYCTWVAQGTVKQFSGNPSLRSRHIEGIRARAIAECIGEYPPKSFTANRSLHSNR